MKEMINEFYSKMDKSDVGLKPNINMLFPKASNPYIIISAYKLTRFGLQTT